MALYASIMYAPAVATVLYQLLFFAITVGFRFDKVTDFAGGSNFIINAVITLALRRNNPDSSTHITYHQIVGSVNYLATWLIIIWALRLSLFLLYRILKTGEDHRFDDIRNNFVKLSVFWFFQMVWVYVVGLSLTVLNASTSPLQGVNATPSLIIGLILFIIGIAMESLADVLKLLHRSYVIPKFKADHPTLQPPLLDYGFCKFCRYPSYFGYFYLVVQLTFRREILVWFGIFLVCLPQNPSIELVTIFSPLFTMFILLFLSGIPLAEKSTQAKHLRSDVPKDAQEVYLRYREATSPLIPMPPSIYRRLPRLIKTFFFFEFEFYESKELSNLLQHSVANKIVPDHAETQ